MSLWGLGAIKFLWAKVLDAMGIKLSTKGDSISKICQNVISKYWFENWDFVSY